MRLVIFVVSYLISLVSIGHEFVLTNKSNLPIFFRVLQENKVFGGDSTSGWRFVKVKSSVSISNIKKKDITLEVNYCNSGTDNVKGLPCSKIDRLLSVSMPRFQQWSLSFSESTAADNVIIKWNGQKILPSESGKKNISAKDVLLVVP